MPARWTWIRPAGGQFRSNGSSASLTSSVSRHATNFVVDPVIPPAPSTIDLHTHTLRSDGVLEPADLVRQAFAAGVRVLAITDHDNLAGDREMRASAALPGGLELLSGVEINAVVGKRDELWEGGLHVPGFGM